MAVVTRVGGLSLVLPFGGVTFNPNTDISYSGSKTVIDDGGGNWRVKFTTSGTLTFTKSPGSVDLFLVGQGAGGGNTYHQPAGGGGGYTLTQSSIIPTVGTEYSIVVGSTGGAIGAAGQSTTGFGYTANGGLSTSTQTGGNGGSGGGGGNATAAGAGGSNGANGGASGGTGQGTTTKEFGESSGSLYGGAGGGGTWTGSIASGGSGGGGNGGGGSGTIPAQSGTANTGGGGGGGYQSTVSGTGGSGIVIIRNAR